MRHAGALRLAVLAGLAAAGVPAGVARAAPSTAALETTGGRGATDCPGAARLAAIVNEGIGRTALVPAGDGSAPPMRVAVTFERAAKGYAATVHIGGAHGGTRKLSNEGPGCAALANAVGVLLTVVMDTDTEPVGEAAGARLPASSLSSSSASAATPHDVTTGDLAVAGGVAEGLVGGWSPTVGLGGTFAYRRWAARLGGVWLPSKSIDVGPGRVEVGLAIARLALCLTTRDDRSQIALGLCAQQQIGWLRGRGAGFDDGGREVDQLWLATGAAIVAGGPLGRSFGWEVDVGASRPLRETRFVVGGAGTVYRSEPAVFMTTFAVTTKLW